MTQFKQPLASMVVALALTTATFAACPASFAQDNSTPTGPKLAPTKYITVDAAKLVYPPDVPMSNSDIFRSSSPEFRPTMGDAAYQAAKVAATSPGPSLKHGGSGIHSNVAGSVVKFSGLTEAQSVDRGFQFNPSDSNGAIGLTQYCEITNDAFEIFSRAGSKIKTTPLSAFFGYSTESMFNPCVKFDPIWHRWVVTSTSFAESTSAMYLHLAASTTDDARGPYYVYTINVAFNYGDFWDNEKLGMTQDAVLCDANVFNGATYEGATFFSFAKAMLYNGGVQNISIFQHLGGTLTLPMVNDQDALAYLIYNEPGTSNIGEYIVTNAAFANQEQIWGPYQVPVGFVYNVPPPAVQPGSPYTLDTSDTRFFNNTVQQGGYVFATNTIYGGGTPSYPINEFWLIDGATQSLAQLPEPFYVSGTSNDFNPAIAVDGAGVGVEWNETDPGSNQQASIYVNGTVYGSSLPSDYGYLVSSSTKAKGTGGSVQPWGEYSSLSVDPTDGTTFWGTNVLVGSASSWKTENFHFLAQ